MDVASDVLEMEECDAKLLNEHAVNVVGALVRDWFVTALDSPESLDQYLAEGHQKTGERIDGRVERVCGEMMRK